MTTTCKLFLQEEALKTQAARLEDHKETIAALNTENEALRAKLTTRGEEIPVLQKDDKQTSNIQARNADENFSKILKIVASEVKPVAAECLELEYLDKTAGKKPKKCP